MTVRLPDNMPRFHFHLYNDTETLDPDGRDFPDLDAARVEAIANARDLMAFEIRTKGEITLSHWIELETEDGDMHVVKFGDSVTINP